MQQQGVSRTEGRNKAIMGDEARDQEGVHQERMRKAAEEHD